MENNIPQGYKESPLGVIPQDWEVRRLGEVATISSGGTPSREKKEYWNGDIPWITTSLVNMPMIYFADEHITDLGLNESSAKILKAQTILMAMYGQGNTRGKVSMLKIIASTNQACAAIVPINQIEEYIYYYLDSKYQTIRDLSNDGGQKNLSLGIIKEFKIILPPLAEQERIAEVLGTWDVAIEKQGALVDALTRRKRALMQQLLTARKRLPNFSAPWQEVELGELLDYEQPTKYLVKSTEYDNSYTTPVLTAGKTFILGYTDEEFGVCEKLPVILFDDFTTASKFVGFKFKVKSSAAKLLYAKGDYDIRFVFEAMQNIRYIVGGHERHWISKFAYITILIPTIEEQKAIAQILTTADKEIELATTKLNSLRTQKRALMQQLLTGKKRLRIWHNK
ncbi:MAG: restriction endonuclease subunit S [Rikenellaceae bacterium]